MGMIVNPSRIHYDFISNLFYNSILQYMITSFIIESLNQICIECCMNQQTNTDKGAPVTVSQARGQRGINDVKW